VPLGQRGRALGRIGAGQLAGGALGVGVGAACVALLSWRWAFFALAVPALLLAPVLARTPEPPRTAAGSTSPVPFSTVARRLWDTPTLVLVLLASTVGSYYLAGASAFSTVFAVARYDVSTPVADLALVALGIGAVAGIVVGSRLSDSLAAKGHGATRLTWTGIAYLVTAAAWLPALHVHSLALALPFLVLGSAALAATIPTLDAVRVDVVAPSMRGRAEALRTVVRAVAEGGAPLVFGVVAAGHGGDDEGLQLGFLLALPGIVLGGLLLVLARRWYDQDRAPVAALEGAG
ncbi:MAG: transporter, partial [Frankiales bacterium]|nr:transporter [Frankiales bacterium]